MIDLMNKYVASIDNKLIENLNFSSYYKLQKAFDFPAIKREFRKRTGYELNLKSPKTYNEKTLWRRLYKRDSLFPVVSDKYRVRNYVKSKIGEQYLIPLLNVCDTSGEINFKSLPNEYIIKINFTSGGNFISRKDIPLDPITTQRNIDSWMTKKYGYSKLLWYVQEIPRKIVIESLLRDSQGCIPNDFKFLCFDGVARYVWIDQDRFSNHTRTLYDRDWNFQNVVVGNIKSTRVGTPIDRPDNLSEMLEIADCLSKDFDAARIDLYGFDKKIYFGEITLESINGMAKIEPVEFDIKLGDIWCLH
jgi:hypothetical protein